MTVKPESTKLKKGRELELASFAFNDIVKKCRTPDIDLLASRTNRKCIRFLSWKEDPWSGGMNAFTLNCKIFFFYIFPPFSTILKILSKNKRDQAEGFLVVSD